MKKLVIIFLLLSSTVCLARPSLSYSFNRECIHLYSTDEVNRWTNCVGKITWPSGDIYVGDLVNGQFHGLGQLTISRLNLFRSGENYYGEWKYNKRNGYGVNVWKNGDKYEGYWVNDKMHGEGIATYKNGKAEEGMWENDKFIYATPVFREETEASRYSYRKPDSYSVIEHDSDPYNYLDNTAGLETGESPERYDAYSGPEYDYYQETVIEKTEREEQERFTKLEEQKRKRKAEEKEQEKKREKERVAKPTCSTHSEIWSNCEGEWNFEGGDKYIGEWKDDKRHGQGTYYHNDGDKYVGEHKDDKANGQGTFYYLADDEWKGDKYVGEFKDDKFNGQGTYYQNDGDTHTGKFKDNKPNGQGTYYYLADNKWRGDELVGEFKDGLANGQGTYYYLADDEYKGDKYVGEFKDGLANGQGTFYHNDGDKYVGEFKDGLANGQGTYYYLADNKWRGDKYVGEFKDDKFNGQGTLFYNDGTKDEGIWENDVLLRSSSTEIKGNEILYDKGDEISYYVVGTGFSVSESGDVITNFHVIEECDDVIIIYDGNDIETTVAATDPYNDLALLKGNFETNYFFAFDDKPIEPRTRINVAGFPHGYDVSTMVVVNEGIISSTVGIGDDVSRFRIDAPIQPGNSGGPVFDKNGNVLGVVVESLDKELIFKETGDIPENANFAIKGYVAKDFLKTHGVKLENPRKKVKPRFVTDLYMNATHAISCGVISKKNTFIEFLKKLARIINRME